MKAKESKLKGQASASRRASSIKFGATKSLLINPRDLVEPLVVIPPDGGWGWVVVLASFIVMFCVDGIGYGFAVFFEDISEDLNCKITDVAMASSLLGGFYYLSGPLTCSAVNRFGFQAVGLIGGVLATGAFLSASYMTTLTPFMILVGFCGGTAFNLIYTPSVIAIGFYFERWRALAMAINCCGSSLGVMCVPLIMTYGFGKLDWRTKFKILSGALGFCGILGLTYKPIKSTKVERTVQFGEVSTLPSVITIEAEKEVTGLTSIFQRFKNALFPTISEVSVYSSRYNSRVPSRYNSRSSGLGYGFLLNRRATTETEAISTYMDVSDDDFVDGKSILGPLKEEESNVEEQKCCRKCIRKCCAHFCVFTQCSGCCKPKTEDISFTNVNRPMYRDDIFYTGSVYALGYPRAGDSHTSGHTSHRIVPSLMYTLSVSRAPTQQDLLQQGQCVCCPEAIVRVLATMLDFQMMKSPTFILLLLSGYLSLLSTYICYTYVAQRGIEMGINKNSATMLLSILGIANTIGRALCGVVSCFPSDINVISWIAISICGISTIVSVFTPTFIGQTIFCCIFGFTIAAFAVLRAIMFVELFGIENLTNCFGLNMVFQSLAAFSGVPLANWIYGSTKDFSLTFMITGAAIILSAVLLIPIRCVLRWEEKHRKK